MKRLLTASLATLALSLAACGDPTEAYTPVDELPSADDPVAEAADAGSLPETTPQDPRPQPLPLPPADPEIPPPMDPVPPLDEATRPPPVDPALEDENPPVEPVP